MNRFVLIATMEEVIPSLPLFAGYKPVLVISLPASTAPSLRQSVGLDIRLSPSRDRNHRRRFTIRQHSMGLFSLEFLDLLSLEGLQLH